MTKYAKGQKVENVIVLLIFCAFAVSVLMVLMFGASIYKNMTEVSREGQNERTTLSYIRTKVKNDDDASRIYVGDFHGQSALCFDEELGGILYRTVVYHYDGWVFELFSEAELEFYPEDGTRIIRIDSLEFESLEYGIIKVYAGEMELLVYPRGGRQMRNGLGTEVA